MKNKAAHLAVGVDTDDCKEVLGIWVETTEGAKFWLRVLNEIRSRGVEDVLVVVCDGLVGLPAAIEAVWPDAVVETCIVHYADLRIMPNVVAGSLAGQGFRVGEVGIIR